MCMHFMEANACVCTLTFAASEERVCVQRAAAMWQRGVMLSGAYSRLLTLPATYAELEKLWDEALQAL